MTRELLLIGAGNVAGFIAYNLNQFEEPFKIVGLLDDDPEKQGKTLFGFPVLGPIKAISDYPNAISVALCIASPPVKRHIHQRLKAYDLTYPNFVSKEAWVSKGVTIGMGTIIYPGVSINHESQIGDFVIMNMNCAIGHNATISSYCSLAPGVNFAGFTYLEEAVDVGIGAATRQNVRVGRNSVLGGQCMVIHDVLPKSVMAGVPARTLKQK